MDYRTYRLDDKYNLYDGKVAAEIYKWQRKIQVRLTVMVFNSTDQISVFNFLQSLQMYCIMNEVHDRAEKWRSQLFLRKEARATLKEKLITAASPFRSLRSHHHDSDPIAMYPEAV